ncbi:MAG: small multi-drug export protein [Candidatus Omnitrophica bacterium]|nr:small multi-drug export protein [Candidatus Omnitrophota bacterium]
MINWILGLPHNLAILLTACLPVFELRGAIPLGFYLKVPLGRVFILSVCGNMLPVVPLLLFLEPISAYLRRFYVFKIFFDWLFKRTKERADLIEKYEALGLALFVSIPLPMTGAWSGAVAASLFKIRFRYAFMAIFLGVIIAGIIVTMLCLLGKLTWNAYR